MRPLRVGVIGFGYFGRRHAGICSELEDIEVVGAADPAQHTEGSRSEVHISRSLGELLKRGLDAAIVATPPTENLAIAQALAEEGVHTLFEKPLATTASDANLIAGTFAGKGLIAGVGHVERFNPAARTLKEALLSQAMGPLRSLEAVRCGPPPERRWALDVGLDLAIHDIDLLQWIGGDLQGLRTAVYEEHRLHAVGTLSGGIPFTVTADRQSSLRSRQLVAHCAQGTLTADLMTHAVRQQVAPGEMSCAVIDSPQGEARVSPLRRELEGFRDAVLGRKSAEVVPLACGAKAVEFITRLREVHAT